MADGLEKYFKYHPPLSKERKSKHLAINSMALEFAKLIDLSVADEDCKKQAIMALLQAKMLANQGVTLDELNSGHNYSASI